jgi:alanine racemase
MSRPTTCTISIAALQHNLENARRHAGGRGVWAVIKAEAYGHGRGPALQGFAAADGLAMLNFEDAVACRQEGWQKPILMLEGAFATADVKLAFEHQLSLVVHSEYQLEWLEQFAAQGRAPQALMSVHLKLNTGMNRLGFKPALAPVLSARIKRLACVKDLVWVTHFANADVVELGQAQFKNFELRDQAPSASVSNSAALINQIGQHGSGGWVRPGIMLYGSSPMGTQPSAQALHLKPAMALRSQVIGVQELQKGDQVGYGSTFTAAGPLRIGIVACGYADGYPRHAGTGTPIAVSGITTRTIGRVSMDMLACDLSPCEDAGVGSEVELWGPQISIDEVADCAGTIGYELMCAVAPRVTRRLTNGFL